MFIHIYYATYNCNLTWIFVSISCGTKEYIQALCGPLLNVANDGHVDSIRNILCKDNCTKPHSHKRILVRLLATALL